MTRTIGPVTAASAAGAALATIICWILSSNGIDVPETVQGSATVLLTILGGYLVPSRSGRHTQS